VVPAYRSPKRSLRESKLVGGALAFVEGGTEAVIKEIWGAKDPNKEGSEIRKVMHIEALMRQL